MPRAASSTSSSQIQNTTSSQSRSNTPWQREELESLIEWMEDNREQVLTGKQTHWYKAVKEALFKEKEHITVKKITDKVNNMKRQWKEARDMAQGSGWGLTPEDSNEQSINDRLEKKCQFFWRLHSLWGTRPNVNIRRTLETQTTTESTKDQPSSRQSSPAPDEGSQSETPRQGSPALSQDSPTRSASLAS